MIPGVEQYIIQLTISAVFAFLIGLEVYAKTPVEDRKYLFGTDRTFTFIAILGFVFLKAEAVIPHMYIAGFTVLSLFLAVYYFNKIRQGNSFGLTIIFLALLIYAFPIILQLFPFWLSMLIIVVVVVLVEIKEKVKTFAEQLYTEDFITLAKFVLLTCVILPLVPDREIITGVPVSPYKLWLAIVAISAISYLGYILKKFVFPKAGLMLTAILGGLYSSTATTFILAKKTHEENDTPAHYAAAILSATVLMFARIYVLVIIFNPPLSIHLLPYFIVMIVVSAATTFFIYRLSPTAAPTSTTNPQELNPPKQNPLELRIALVFGVLYITFSLLTQYTLQYFGNGGLNVLSFIVGVTDIDPFLLNIFQGKYTGLTTAVIGTAIFHAIASNNILKMIYALSIGNKPVRKYLAIGFGAIIAANIILLFFL